ncbi:MAG: glutamine synthetase beta-grasp domain-containing protein [Bacteriovoracales bacterium]|nr:glutamine synthetase beta-grasp domain-containing protein [Bacteriovoracales bacterium]
MKKLNYAEYIWLDGASPTQELRSKTRMLYHKEGRPLDSFPEWSFDGSSTWQALGRSSDCLLKPAFFTKDPTREGENYIVLCEVLNADSTSHPTNRRADLRRMMEQTAGQDPYIGFEQEYTFFTGELESEKWPMGWPKGGYPSPQGPFYCGIGAGRVYGRHIVEEHSKACEAAGLNIYGVNAEVMPSQWEFQIGYRGEDEPSDPLTMSDHLWVARYLLHRIAEKYGVSVSFSNKPVRGDWNGAGMHTNFSTKSTRDKARGLDAINEAIKNLGAHHLEHIKNYGEGLEDRLTGLHETCHISEFKSGVSNRGASIRIPVATHQQGHGYLEDRRPGANADPYVVSSQLLEAICLG